MTRRGQDDARRPNREKEDPPIRKTNWPSLANEYRPMQLKNPPSQADELPLTPMPNWRMVDVTKKAALAE